MDTIQFISTVILITASGALAPGPLFFATISQGAKSGIKSGLIFAVTHNIVEFTLVMLLAGSLLTVANQPTIMLIMGIAGGVALLAFGVMQIKSSLKMKSEENVTKERGKSHLFLFGLAFTGLNPFFIIWWLTAGAKLILLSIEFASLAGVIFMYICHVWMDYVWLTMIAHFASIGTKIVGFQWYRIIMAVFGFILIYYGFNFLIGSLTTWALAS